MNEKLSQKENPLLKENKVVLSRPLRWFIFFIFCTINVTFMLPGGILSSGITQIKSELNLTDQEFALTGSLNCIGTIFGSLFFSLIINKVNRKWLLIVSVFFESLCPFIIFLSDNYIVFLVCRFATGIQVLLCLLYFPVWINQYSLHNWKTFMLTFFQLSGMFGFLGGYFLNAFLGSDKWRIGFLIESVYLFFTFLSLICVPERYFHKSLFFKHVDEEEFQKTQNVSLVSIFVDSERKDSNDSKSDKQKEKCALGELLSNAQFVVISFVKACQMFIAGSIGFWFSDYIENTLNVKDSKQIFISYSFSSVFAPVLGMILGGIINSAIGGYGSKSCVKAMLILQILATVFGLYLPFADDLKYFTIFICGYNFFSGGSGSIAIGFTFAILPEKLTGIANGFTGLFINLVAFLPGPPVFGFLKNYFESGKIAMRFLMILSVVATVLLLVLECLRARKSSMQEESEEEKIQLQERTAVE